MVKKNSRWISMALVALGLAMVAAAAVMWVLMGDDSRLLAVTGGLVGLISMLMGATGALGKKPAPDERTVKLSAYAASWSWLSAVVVTSALFLLAFWSVVTVDAITVLELVLLTLLATGVVFNAYYRLRGDV